MTEIDRGTSEPRKHKGPKLLRIITVTLIVAALFNTSLSLLPDSSSDISPEPLPTPAKIAYDVHAPILINDSADFASQAVNESWPGNGGPSTPYIIQGYDINAASTNGIYIRNSSVHFIVRNCSVHDGGSSNNGIYLYNCKNGTINNNSLTDNSDGIYLHQSSDNNISDNNCSLNSHSGICLQSWSGSNTLVNNTCQGGEYGIMVTYSSSNNALSDNICLDNYYGVYLYYYVYASSVSNNNCSDNEYGIYLYTSSSNEITRNQLCENTQYGIYIRDFDSGNSMIWNNTFYHNNGAGDIYDASHIQGYDDGVDNLWYTPGATYGYGNWWSDWTMPDVVSPLGIVDIPYNITGTFQPKDYYPLTTPAPPIPEFSEFIIPIAGLMLIALIFGRTRKKP